MAYRRIIALLYIVSQLLLGFVPASAADGSDGCSDVIEDCETTQCISNDGIRVQRVRTHHAISPQVLFENWPSGSQSILHVRPLVRPDKVPDFFASSLRCTFLRHSVFLI